MTQKSRRIFLDTSVVFAALLPPTGGARKLFHLAEAGVLNLVVGPNVLRESEEVIKRKAPAALADLARLLAAASVETSAPPLVRDIADARAHVAYAPDARVLGEALRASPDWFITHDKKHFLGAKSGKLPFRVGTPGDLIQALQDELAPPET